MATRINYAIRGHITGPSLASRLRQLALARLPSRTTRAITYDLPAPATRRRCLNDRYQNGNAIALIIRLTMLLLFHVLRHIYALSLLYIPSRYADRSRRLLASPSLESGTEDLRRSGFSALPNVPSLLGVDTHQSAIDRDSDIDARPVISLTAAGHTPLSLEDLERQWDTHLVALRGEWKMIQLISGALIP
ncbi:hypothetical protein DXG01_001522 [Tephrocybe rancida]|nr:hypothetical protein DXG01_001522 [Tephrocybe rancida]